MENGATTTYVYDAAGRLAAECGGTSPVVGTVFATRDPLGSTRMLTDSDGFVLERYDYLPFGEEIPAGAGGRTTAMAYGAGSTPSVTTTPDVTTLYPSSTDDVNQKFTGKERDLEGPRPRLLWGKVHEFGAGAVHIF
jgi:hypothetical protein